MLLFSRISHVPIKFIVPFGLPIALSFHKEIHSIFLEFIGCKQETFIFNIIWSNMEVKGTISLFFVAKFNNKSTIKTPEREKTSKY